MKKKLLLLATAVLLAVLCTVGIGAVSDTVTAEGTCGDNLTWVLYSDGELVIDGTGKMWDWDREGAAPWYSKCSSIKTVTIGDNVTSIGDYAFYYCTSLTSVTIPDSVTFIGNYAFSDCTSLTSITIPDSVYYIHKSAFEGCTSLTSVSVGVSTGGDYYGCFIGDSAFNGCTALENVTLGQKVTSIDTSAFYGCTSLTSIVLPDKLTTIGIGAFRKCENLASVTIPASVTSIGNYAFKNTAADFTIYGIYGSTAQTYATENDIPFVSITNPEDAKVTFTITSVSTKPGETVDLTLSVESMVRLNSIGLRNLIYDPAVLTFVGFVDTEAMTEKCTFAAFDEEKGIITLGLETSEVLTGAICTLRFTVNPDVTDGTASVGMTSIVKQDAVILPSVVTTATVSVKTYVAGDINGDDTVDISDALRLFQYSLMPDAYPIAYLGNVDYNNDGVLDINDALLLFKHSLMPDLYPIA